MKKQIRGIERIIIDCSLPEQEEVEKFLKDNGYEITATGHHPDKPEELTFIGEKPIPDWKDAVKEG